MRYSALRMISPSDADCRDVLGVATRPCNLLALRRWPHLLNKGTAWRGSIRMVCWAQLSPARGLFKVILPGITADILTGVRLAIGIIWIVLVPAEMLGVSAGLGYFILDTRDRLAYSELMAAIVLIGILGFILDYLARAAHARWLHVKN